MKTKMIAVASAVLVLGAPAAQAGDFYLLGTVGQSKIESFDKGGADRDLAGAGFTGVVSSVKDTDTAWKLQLGYQFNENFALEGGYYTLGDVIKYNAVATQGAVNLSGKVDGWNISAVGILPLTNQFGLFGKLGAAYSTGKSDSSILTAGGRFATSQSDSKWGANYGVGLSYAITQSVALRGEYERYDDVGDGDKVNVWSLGIAYKF